MNQTTFLLAAVDDLQVFGHRGTGVRLRVGVRKAEGPIITHLPVVGKESFHCAAACGAITRTETQQQQHRVGSLQSEPE